MLRTGQWTATLGARRDNASDARSFDTPVNPYVFAKVLSFNRFSTCS
jgi:hypothetical protein